MGDTPEATPSVAPPPSVVVNTNKRKDNGDPKSSDKHDTKRARSNDGKDNTSGNNNESLPSTDVPLYQWSAANVSAYIRSDAIGVRKAVAQKWMNEGMDGATVSVLRSSDELRPTGLNMGERIRVWAWIYNSRTPAHLRHVTPLPARTVAMSRTEVDGAVASTALDDSKQQSQLNERLILATTRPLTSDIEYGERMLVDPSLVTKLKLSIPSAPSSLLVSAITTDAVSHTSNDSVPACLTSTSTIPSRDASPSNDLLPLIITALDMKPNIDGIICKNRTRGQDALLCIDGQSGWFDRYGRVQFVKLAHMIISASNSSSDNKISDSDARSTSDTKRSTTSSSNGVNASKPLIDHYSAVGIIQLECGNATDALSSRGKGRLARINQRIRTMQATAGNTSVTSGKAKKASTTEGSGDNMITSVLMNGHRMCLVQTQSISPLEGNGGPVWESRCSPDYLMTENGWQYLVAWINTSPSTLGWPFSSFPSTLSLAPTPSSITVGSLPIRLHGWLGSGRTGVCWRVSLGDRINSNCVAKVFPNATNAWQEISVLQHADAKLLDAQLAAATPSSTSPTGVTLTWPIGMPRLVGTTPIEPNGMMMVTTPFGRPLTEIHDIHVRQGVALCWWLHKNGIEHCDLEPRHFMTTINQTTGIEELLVIDWGFARLSSVGSHRHPGMFVHFLSFSISFG
jgi:hypothetical protein